MDISDQKKNSPNPAASLCLHLQTLFAHVFQETEVFFFYRRDGGDVVCPSMPTMKSYEACRNSWL